MQLVLPLLFGLLTAIVGILPPGLLNMTAVKVNLKEGKKNAHAFVAGTLIVIFFQSYLAILFARVLDKNPETVLLFKKISCFAFAALSIYFFLTAKKSKITKAKISKKSTKKRFFLGMLLSALNLFPIPYYVFISVSLASYGLFSFESAQISMLLIGIFTGSLFVFLGYLHYFQKKTNQPEFFLQNSNTIIGTITAIVAIAAFFNLLKTNL